jgi:hypothetical protein
LLFVGAVAWLYVVRPQAGESGHDAQFHKRTHAHAWQQIRNKQKLRPSRNFLDTILLPRQHRIMSSVLRIFALAAASVWSVGYAWSVEPAAAPVQQRHQSVQRWMDEWRNEVCRLASPIPEMLFSNPPSLFITDSSPLEWLTGVEIASLRERLNPDARLMGLTDRLQVIDPIFWELVTTDGLIIDLDQRPKAPVNYPFFHRCTRNPFWTSFWLRNHPVPSSLRPMVFTQDLLQEGYKLSRSAIRRFCSYY